jgi:hypothetical protein
LQPGTTPGPPTRAANVSKQPKEGMGSEGSVERAGDGGEEE